MSRRYAERVEVTLAGTGAETRADAETSTGADAGDAPVAFVWRRRRHRVTAVLAGWVEAAPWWDPQQGVSERLVWRVETAAGVFDLCRATLPRPGPAVWFLVRAFD